MSPALPTPRRASHRRRRFRGLCAAIKLAGGRRDRLPRGREGQRRRRHLARQHLPRRRLRRPEPALLVLLRAEPRVVVVVLPAAGDPGLPRAGRRSASGTLDRFVFDTEIERRDLGRRPPSAGRCDRRTGRRAEVTSTTLIVGAGGLSEPQLPEIDGIETFQGALFHSARWDHDVDLAGKRVAVIGTGASAIQIVPELQQVAAHLDVYQRTAPWVIPRNDRPLHRARAGRAPPRAGPRQALPHRHLLGARGLRARRSPGSRSWPCPAAEGRRRQHPQGHQGPRAARQGHARPSRSAASASCARTPTTPRSPPTTSTWSPTRSRRSPATRSSPPTASSARST